MNSVSCAICVQRLVHPLGDRAAHPTELRDRCRLLHRRRERAGSSGPRGALARRSGTGAGRRADQRPHVLGDAVPGDPPVGRVGSDRREVDAEQVGELAGGCGCRDDVRRRPRDAGAGGGRARCGRSVGRGDTVEVRVDDPSTGAGAADRAEIDAAFLREPLGHRRRDDPSAGAPCSGRRAGAVAAAAQRRAGAGAVAAGGAAAAGRPVLSSPSSRNQPIRSPHANVSPTCADDVQATGRGGLDVGLGLVGLDPQHGRAVLDGVTVGDEPFGDGALLHRESELRHEELSRHGCPFVGDASSSRTSKRRSSARELECALDVDDVRAGTFDRHRDGGVGRDRSVCVRRRTRGLRRRARSTGSPSSSGSTDATSRVENVPGDERDTRPRRPPGRRGGCRTPPRLVPIDGWTRPAMLASPVLAGLAMQATTQRIVVGSVTARAPTKAVSTSAASTSASSWTTVSRRGSSIRSDDALGVA